MLLQASRAARASRAPLRGEGNASGINRLGRGGGGDRAERGQMLRGPLVTTTETLFLPRRRVRGDAARRAVRREPPTAPPTRREGYVQPDRAPSTAVGDATDHIDPDSQHGRLREPFLHGLCTYGIVGRASSEPVWARPEALHVLSAASQTRLLRDASHEDRITRPEKHRRGRSQKGIRSYRSRSAWNPERRDPRWDSPFQKGTSRACCHIG